MGHAKSKHGVVVDSLAAHDEQCLKENLASLTMAELTAHYDPALSGILSALLANSASHHDHASKLLHHHHSSYKHNSDQLPLKNTDHIYDNLSSLLIAASGHDFRQQLQGNEDYQRAIAGMTPEQYATALLSSFFALYKVSMSAPAVTVDVLEENTEHLPITPIKFLPLTVVNKLPARTVDWFLFNNEERLTSAQNDVKKVVTENNRLPSLKTLLDLGFLRHYVALAKISVTSSTPTTDKSSLVLRHLTQDRSEGLMAPHVSGVFSRMLISYADMYILNTYLPSTDRNEWQLVYCSERDGLSWTTFQFAVASHPGAMMLVIRDKGGAVFGGFTSSPLAIGPTFQTNTESFLFRLAPTISVHLPSGYNNNFLYFNHGASTLPNGIGFGGQMEYHGLWLNSDFATGHSMANPTSTTYSSPMLSSTSEFVVDAIDCYLVRAAAIDPNIIENDKRNILEKNPEVVEFMEMTGRRMYSKEVQADYPQEFESHA